ncbi:MAG: acyl-[acyl-carrier-protein] thioesterase [Oligosphaeraceae bacterium]
MTQSVKGIQEYKLRYSECDRFGRIKLKTFFDYAQEIAGVHASALGVGLETLLPLRRSWFLSRMKLEILHYPEVGSDIRVTTWPAGFDRLLARREFRFEERVPSSPGSGDAVSFRMVARATSNWLLMDTAAMRILPAERLCGPLLEGFPMDDVAFPTLGKLPALPENEDSLRLKVRPTQIDVNGHLNNAEYAAILQDALGIGVYPATFQLNYQKAVPPEATLSVSCQRDGGGAEGFLCTGRVDGAVSFEAAGTLLDVKQGEQDHGI